MALYEQYYVYGDSSSLSRYAQQGISYSYTTTDASIRPSSYRISPYLSNPDADIAEQRYEEKPKSKPELPLNKLLLLI